MGKTEKWLTHKFDYETWIKEAYEAYKENVPEEVKKGVCFTLNVVWLKQVVSCKEAKVAVEEAAKKRFTFLSKQIKEIADQHKNSKSDEPQKRAPKMRELLKNYGFKPCLEQFGKNAELMSFDAKPYHDKNENETKEEYEKKLGWFKKENTETVKDWWGAIANWITSSEVRESVQITQQFPKDWAYPNMKYLILEFYTDFKHSKEGHSITIDCRDVGLYMIFDMNLGEFKVDAGELAAFFRAWADDYKSTGESKVFVTSTEYTTCEVVGLEDG